jgi:hypothetical protein
MRASAGGEAKSAARRAKHFCRGALKHILAIDFFVYFFYQEKK